MDFVEHGVFAQILALLASAATYSQTRGGDNYPFKSLSEILLNHL